MRCKNVVDGVRCEKVINRAQEERAEFPFCYTCYPRDKASTLCIGTNKQGEPCRQYAIANLPYCHHHAPRLSTSPLQIRLPAAPVRRGKAALKAEQDRVEEELTVRALKIQSEIVDIQSMDDLRNFVMTLVNDVRAGLIDAKKATALKQLLEFLRDVMKALRPMDDRASRKATHINIIAQNMTLEQAWKINQAPVDTINRLIEEEGRIADAEIVKSGVEQEKLDKAKKQVLDIAEKLLFGGEENVKEEGQEEWEQLDEQGEEAEELSSELPGDVPEARDDLEFDGEFERE